MKPRTLPVLVALMLGAVTSARAELVRLSFTDWDGNFIWKADSGLVSWNAASGYIPHLEIFYDTTSISGGTLDPARNFFRFSVIGPKPGVQFYVNRPLEYITYSESEGYQTLEFQRSTSAPDYGLFDFDATFQGTAPLEGSLPIPPAHFDYGELHYVSGGPEWFPLPHMGEGYGYGEFDSVSASVVTDTTGFSPVPEPSTYGVAGAAVLGLAWLRRRFSRFPPPAKP